MRKKLTAAEKRTLNEARDGRGGPGGTPKFRQVDSVTCRVYLHLYAATKKLADEAGVSLTSALNELIRLGLAQKLGLRAADVPTGEL